MTDSSEVISVGDYVILQRKNYLKVHRVDNSNDITLGKDKVNAKAIINERYWTVFKMVQKSGSKREFLLEKESNPICLDDTLVPDVAFSSGCDNRNITDDGKSQKLSTDEIISLREKGLSSSSIVGKLLENSTTYNSKTEYSQEKYLKKKERKYFEYITIRKPTIRLLAEVFYSRDQMKVLGLRFDTLSQILAYANLRHNGNYLLFETSTQGLLSALFLDHLSSEGKIVNISLGNYPQKHAVLAMNYPPNKLNSLLSVKLSNIFEFLCAPSEDNMTDKMDSVKWSTEISRKRKLDSQDDNTETKKPKWAGELAEALSILSNRSIDGLIVATKEFSVPLIETLLKFMKPSRPLIVYNTFKEPLVQLYLKLKERRDILCLHITENFTRHYQVLPGRTHPNVLMSPNSGFLLTAVIV